MRRGKYRRIGPQGGQGFIEPEISPQKQNQINLKLQRAELIVNELRKPQKKMKKCLAGLCVVFVGLLMIMGISVGLIFMRRIKKEERKRFRDPLKHGIFDKKIVMPISQPKGKEQTAGEFIEENLKDHHKRRQRHSHRKKFYINCTSANIDKKKMTGDLHCKVVFYGRDKDKKFSSSSSSSEGSSEENL